MPLWDACRRARWGACYGELRRMALMRTPVNKSRDGNLRARLCLDPRLTKSRYGPFSAVKQVSPAQLFNACRRPASASTRGDGAYWLVRSWGS
jgi:hypothetical protein